MAQYRRQVQPTQYISQYDPLLNQRIEQDLAQRDKAFKQTYAGMAEEQARQGDIFFLDIEAKGELAKGFEQKKQSILEKYNGEYDKAAPELTNLVVQEHNNPLYQLNNLQIRKKDEFDKLKVAYGPDMLVHKDVPNSIIRNGMPISPEELDYDVEKRSNYDKVIMDASKGVLNSVDQTRLTSSTKGYLESIKTKGIDNLDNDQKEEFFTNIGEVLDNVTTFSRDESFNNSREQQTQKGYDYVKRNAQRLFPSIASKSFVQDRGWIKPGTILENDDDYPLFSPRERGIIPPKKNDYINDYLNAEKLLNNVVKNKGVLEMIPAMQSMVIGLGNRLDLRGYKTTLIHLEKKDPIAFNKLIELVSLTHSDHVNHFVKKDNKGDYKFTVYGDSGASYIGNKLMEMAKNDNNYIDKVTRKYNDSYTNFKNEYGIMYNYLKEKGIPEKNIISKIQESENKYQFNNTYDLNSEEFAQNIHNKIISVSGDKVKLYKRKSNGELSENAERNGKNELIDKTIQTAIVDPQSGSILLTYKGKNEYSTYGVKINENTLDNMGNKILAKLTKFTNNLNSLTTPEQLIPINKEYGYYSVKDPNTLETIVYKVGLRDDDIITDLGRVNISVVYDDLLLLLLRTENIKNVSKPKKF